MKQMITLFVLNYLKWSRETKDAQLNLTNCTC